jgi:transcriptional regulator with XRE-family HTH domain
MPNEGLYEDWGQRLRAERQSQGLTQHELSRRSGVSQQMVSGIERGLFGAGDDTRRALARALGTRPAELFPYPEDLAPVAGAS